MPSFSTLQELEHLIDEYFENLIIEPISADATSKTKIEKSPVGIKDNLHERPALLSGLALYLGFNSMTDFDTWERKTKYRHTLRAGRLRIQQEYEKKLHQPAPTGAMFALRCMGWADKPATEAHTLLPKKFRIEVVETGPAIASNEKDVLL